MYYAACKTFRCRSSRPAASLLVVPESIASCRTQVLKNRMAFLAQCGKKFLHRGNIAPRLGAQLTRSMQKSITSTKADFQGDAGNGARASRAIVP